MKHDTRSKAEKAAHIVALILELAGRHDVHVRQHSDGFLVMADGKAVEKHTYAAEF
jgi:hypothetical protein